MSAKFTAASNTALTLTTFPIAQPPMSFGLLYRNNDPGLYVRLTREGKANPLFPWPNGETGSLESARKK